jgi:hypothetical protein
MAGGPGESSELRNRQDNETGNQQEAHTIGIVSADDRLQQTGPIRAEECTDP